MNDHAIRPMLATLGKPPTRYTDFAVEAKYDGQQGVAVVDREQVTLLSRNGADITATFPEITAALPSALSNRRVVLDGEIEPSQSAEHSSLHSATWGNLQRLNCRHWHRNLQPPVGGSRCRRCHCSHSDRRIIHRVQRVEILAAQYRQHARPGA
jgi:hypothetical protein